MQHRPLNPDHVIKAITVERVLPPVGRPAPQLQRRVTRHPSVRVTPSVREHVQRRPRQHLFPGFRAVMQRPTVLSITGLGNQALRCASGCACQAERTLLLAAGSAGYQRQDYPRAAAAESPVASQL